MHAIFRKTVAHPALAIGSALLWGVVELIALQRARRAIPRSRGTGQATLTATASRQRQGRNLRASTGKVKTA